MAMHLAVYLALKYLQIISLFSYCSAKLLTLHLLFICPYVYTFLMSLFQISSFNSLVNKNK